MRVTGNRQNHIIFMALSCEIIHGCKRYEKEAMFCYFCQKISKKTNPFGFEEKKVSQFTAVSPNSLSSQ